jgi:hypothetical protein
MLARYNQCLINQHLFQDMFMFLDKRPDSIDSSGLKRSSKVSTLRKPVARIGASHQKKLLLKNPLMDSGEYPL